MRGRSMRLGRNDPCSCGSGRKVKVSARRNRRLVSILEGRFVVEARHAGRLWEVVVEPDERRRLLVVIAAYPVDQGER